MDDVENPPQEAVDPVDQYPTDTMDQMAAQAERLQMFQQMLIKRRMEAVQARAASGVERRWLDDTDNYHGRDMANRRIDIMEAAQGAQIIDRRTPGQQQQLNRSTVFVQLTRQKTNAGSARVSDMLFPTDERNWGIKPTPVPELMDAVKDRGDEVVNDPTTGQPLNHPTRTAPDAQGNPQPTPLTVGDIALEQMSVAQKKAEAMQKEMDDQLTECQYNYEGRKVIQDAAMLGTGILKGPAASTQVAKKWTEKQGTNGETVHVLEVLQELKPRSYRVDPWNFYPDPACGEDIQDGTYVFERDYLAGRKLARLAQVQGYNKFAIAECLREGPKRIAQVGDYQDQKRAFDLAYDQTGKYDDKRYEMWIYTGEVDRDDLMALGVDVPDDPMFYLMPISAVIVMVNERVIKAILNPMDTGDFPYDVFNWERVTQSPFGIGIPYLMRYAQRTLNAAWRAMLDNMALSSGPQIIIDRKKVTPADGSWTLTARKIWFATGEGETDVEKAMEVFEVASHQSEIANIITMSQQFADIETSLPQIAQGDKGSAPDSVGGMTILMNSANSVLKRVVRNFDDQITRPHLRRYYDWNMQYNPKDEIKGDFEVDARGSSVLVVRDLQQQGLMQLFQLSQNPEFGIYINKENLFRKGLELNHITADDVMNTPEQIQQALKAQQQQPPVPLQVQVAQANNQSREAIAKLNAQTQTAIAQQRTQVAESVQQSKQESEQAYAETEAQMARDNAAAKISEMQMQREILILTYSMKQNLTLIQAKTQLAQLAMQINSDHAIHDSTQAAQARSSGPAVPIESPDQELSQ